MDKPLGARLAAEALGTFFFFFMGFTGIAVVVEYGLGAIGTLGVAAAFGFGLALAITAFGHVSGGHYNPAVTAGLAVSERFPYRDVAPYWVAQVFGGLCAAGTMALVCGDKVTDQLSTNPGPAIGDFSGVSDWEALLLEAIVTGLLVMVVLTVATDDRAAWKGVMAPFLIGLVIFTGATAVGPFSGGSFNPARSFVPIVYNGDWGNLWIYLVGPFAGGMLGGGIWTYVCARDSLWTRRGQTRSV
jgi:MIP family channel proteins